MNGTGHKVRTHAFAGVLVVLAGVLTACGGAGSSSSGAEDAEQAAHRCAPTRSSVADLTARIPPLGPVASAAWCVMALGTPDTSRLSVPGPHDWVYYAVVRLADPAAADGWGPWRPSGGPASGTMPDGLRPLVPDHAQWWSDGAGAYLDRASATLVLGGVSDAGPHPSQT